MKSRSLRDGAAVLGILCLWAGATRSAFAGEADDVDVYDLTIEQLLDTEVTSVSRRAEPIGQAPAAIDVITSEDIRRSGAQSLPEVLRLARNLEVAQIDAQRYAISARGFNSYEASNKLLVLIDGRSVYTPLYSGVFWDQQHVPLQDIARIEVVSGPGGTLWGANAVNGVINIITQGAEDTQGLVGSLFAGDVNQRVDVRYGAAFGDTGHFRIFASGFELGPTVTVSGNDAGDGWNGLEGGFRADWSRAEQRFMLQGALYADELDFGGSHDGGHLQGRWTRLLGDGSTLEAQAYYSSEQRDAALRAAPGIFDSLKTWDFSIQHNIHFGRAHQIVWGGGYRNVASEFINSLNPIVFAEPRRTLETINVFAQDQLALRENLSLTLGLKLEDHTFTGLEYMPNARLAWRPSEDVMVWGAVSRAVRTPSRIDEELSFPGFIIPFAFDSEELLAYELGLRLRPMTNATLSATFYWHDYDKLRTSTRSPPLPGHFPVWVGNGLDGDVHGMEFWGDWAVRENWRLSAGLTLLESDFETKPLSFDVNGSGADPDFQVFVRSQANLTDRVTFDFDLRAIDEPSPQVPRYVNLNARLGWRVTESVEIAFSGRNILDNAHPESFDISPLLQSRRSFEVSARLAY